MNRLALHSQNPPGFRPRRSMKRIYRAAFYTEQSEVNAAQNLIISDVVSLIFVEMIGALANCQVVNCCA